MYIKSIVLLYTYYKIIIRDNFYVLFRFYSKAFNYTYFNYLHYFKNKTFTNGFINIAPLYVYVYVIMYYIKLRVFNIYYNNIF